MRDSPLQSTLVTEWLEDDVWRKANCILQADEWRLQTSLFQGACCIFGWLTSKLCVFSLNLFLGFLSTRFSVENPNRSTSLRSNWFEMLNGVESTTWPGLRSFKGQTSNILAQRFLKFAISYSKKLKQSTETIRRYATKGLVKHVNKLINNEIPCLAWVVRNEDSIKYEE